MEYIYAAMLLHKAGKPVGEASVKKLLEAAGVSVDDAKLKALVASLEGVDIDKVVKEASVVSAAPATAGAKEEKKKPEKKEEEDKPSQEEAAQGLSALFG